jgi:hypothetical protein
MVRFLDCAGRFMETRYELLSYGIPVDVLPFDFDGNWRIEYHHTWLQLQQAAEQQRQQQEKPQAVMGSYSSVSLDDTTDIGIAMAAAPANSSSVVWGAGGGDNCFQNQNGSYYVASNISGGNCDNEDAGTPLPTVTSTTSMVQASPLYRSSTLSEATTAMLSSNSSSSDGAVIFHLEPMDVLLGSGHTIDDRPGNVRFRHLLLEHLEYYDRASKLQKTAIAQHLVKYLKETQNVRFLQRRLISSGSSAVSVGGGSGDSGVGWVEVDDKTVREKISRTFRRLRQSTKK